MPKRSLQAKPANEFFVETENCFDELAEQSPNMILIAQRPPS